MNESQLNLKQLSEDQLIQLALDVYTEQNMRASEGSQSRKKRVREASAGSLGTRSNQALRKLRRALEVEASGRGISIIVTVPGNAQALARHALDSMTAKAHRDVGETYLRARAASPRPEQKQPHSASVGLTGSQAEGQSKETNDKEKAFSHTTDYSSVICRGQTHTLTSRQAQMVEILHKASIAGTPDVRIQDILEQLETKNSRWQDTWKGNPKAKQALIKSGARVKQRVAVESYFVGVTDSTVII